ncbi:hypothetical protein LC608_27415 [Nostoc sp. XA010]|uniref:hypothetical protein n=1 Tax=Nostoc sp. XA010 TaxID=2780407 RepID=UPI001E58AF31|nr:hypothetical protein [Nostoc sp. XA010]MCC5660642.1 hypothetical protein [Nostoc sp. XA010]
MSLIEKLTPEQEALIPVYREKWRAIALSTERIDKEKAAEAVKATYVAMDVEQPEIIFCDSPYAAYNWMLKRLSPQLIESYLREPNNLGSLFSGHFFQELSSQLNQQLGDQVHTQLNNCLYLVADHSLNHEMLNSLLDNFSTQLNEQLEDSSWWIETQLHDCFKPEEHVDWMTEFDFCISVLNILYPQHECQEFAKNYRQLN